MDRSDVSSKLASGGLRPSTFSGEPTERDSRVAAGSTYAVDECVLMRMQPTD